jgi:hypothetical protein
VPVPALPTPASITYIPRTPQSCPLQLSTKSQFDAACTDGNFAFVDNANTFVLKQTFDAAVIEKYAAVGASNIDCALASVYSRTISGATTFTVSNVAAAGSVSSFILELTNGGSATVTWWAGVKWAGGTPPTLTAAGLDILGFYTRDGGTTWRGSVLAKDSK